MEDPKFNWPNIRTYIFKDYFINMIHKAPNFFNTFLYEHYSMEDGGILDDIKQEATRDCMKTYTKKYRGWKWILLKINYSLLLISLTILALLGAVGII